MVTLAVIEPARSRSGHFNVGALLEGAQAVYNDYFVTVSAETEDEARRKVRKSPLWPKPIQMVTNTQMQAVLLKRQSR